MLVNMAAGADERQWIKWGKFYGEKRGWCLGGVDFGVLCDDAIRFNVSSLSIQGVTSIASVLRHLRRVIEHGALRKLELFSTTLSGNTTASIVQALLTAKSSRLQHLALCTNESRESIVALCAAMSRVETLVVSVSASQRLLVAAARSWTLLNLVFKQADEMHTVETWLKQLIDMPTTHRAKPLYIGVAFSAPNVVCDPSLCTLVPT
jgi:hypothetical protein